MSQPSMFRRIVERAGRLSLALALAACTGKIGTGSSRGGEGPGAGGQGASGGSGMVTAGRGGTGTGGVSGSGGTAPPVTDTTGPSQGRMRLLTRAQLENSLADLLGSVDLGPTPPDSDDFLPSVGSTYNELTDSAVDLYHGAIKKMLEGYFADGTRRQTALVDCTPTGPADATCFRKFVAGFGQRAWRRPLLPVEVDRYGKVALDAAARANDPFKGLFYAALGLLDSPNFLYRIELGTPDPKAGGRYRFDSYEMASRLSYFLTASTPDAALLAAAAANKLDTPDGIRAEVTRLLGTEKGKRGMANFAREFFQLDGFAAKPMDDPRYTATLRKAMSEEVQYLYGGLVAAGVDALEIIDTNKAYVNDELAKIYGITGITSKTGVPATLPPNIPRAGILGRGPFLAGTSADKGGATAPILRGLFIAQSMLCRDVPPPPPGVPALPDPPPGSMPTAREQLERHRADPGCAACHALFDPMGLSFETFDPVGAYRDKDPNGRPYVTDGSLDGMPFKDSRELVAMIRKSPDAERCFTANLFRYALGHVETPGEKAVDDEWRQGFSSDGRQLAKFLTRLVTSDGFRYASPVPAQGATPDPGPSSTPTGGAAGSGGTGGGTATGGTGGTVTGNLDQLCTDYCACMSGGKCSGNNPQNCLATCKQSGGKWAVGCRLDKCKIAQHDYSDQLEGDCKAAIGINACWDAQ
jgi:hypothetical protein